ncbi:MAG: prephenate dehydratase [Candidatus Omnitrophica bacterium]|nr:prephenate dehydratase [Candidatus Omnitrophota bacterium]
MPAKLKKLREQIDKIDDKILDLLNKRAKEVIMVSQLKQEKNIATFAPEREALIYRRLLKLNQGPLSEEDVYAVFKEVVSVCRSLRVLLNISYFGPEGTFTHLAALKKFGKKPNFKPQDNIAEVFENVENGSSDYGVIPIENSIEGVVNHTLDMFLVSPLKICSEITLTVEHFLLGDPAKTIKRLYSHPQVLAQCRRWISKNFSQIELIEASSTAKAAILAKKDEHGACLGNKALAEIYDLKVLKSRVEDSSQNFTRFLVISKNDSKPSGKDKTSLLFSIKDRAGALYDVLSSFKNCKINLTKIESRPSKKKPWEYYFFVDLEGHSQSSLVQRALKLIEKQTSFVRVLGSYPKGI